MKETNPIDTEVARIRPGDVVCFANVVKTGEVDDGGWPVCRPPTIHDPECVTTDRGTVVADGDSLVVRWWKREPDGEGGFFEFDLNEVRASDGLLTDMSRDASHPDAVFAVPLPREMGLSAYDTNADPDQVKRFLESTHE